MTRWATQGNYTLKKLIELSLLSRAFIKNVIKRSSIHETISYIFACLWSHGDRHNGQSRC